MKRVFVLLAIFLLSTGEAFSTSWVKEAGEISFQAREADRIAIGTIKSMLPFFDHTDVTIVIEEWLKNPIPAAEILVAAEEGTNMAVAGAARFATGERVLLMLEDVNPGQRRFKLLNMELGKHPVSDRSAVIREIGQLPPQPVIATYPLTKWYLLTLLAVLVLALYFKMRRRK